MFEPYLSTFWLAQVIGIAAVLLMALSLQGRTRKTILIVETLGALVFALHFYLLTAYVGMLASLIVAARNVVFEVHDEWHWSNHRTIPLLFMAGALVVPAADWQGLVSLLPVLSVVVVTQALWSGKPAAIRFAFLLSFILWMPYHLSVGSYAGILNELVLAASVLVGMYRYDQRWIKHRLHFPKHRYR